MTTNRYGTPAESMLCSEVPSSPPTSTNTNPSTSLEPRPTSSPTTTQGGTQLPTTTTTAIQPHFRSPKPVAVSVQPFSTRIPTDNSNTATPFPELEQSSHPPTRVPADNPTSQTLLPTTSHSHFPSAPPTTTRPVLDPTMPTLILSTHMPTAQTNPGIESPHPTQPAAVPQSTSTPTHSSERGSQLPTTEIFPSTRSPEATRVPVPRPTNDSHNSTHVPTVLKYPIPIAPPTPVSKSGPTIGPTESFGNRTQLPAAPVFPLTIDPKPTPMPAPQPLSFPSYTPTSTIQKPNSPAMIPQDRLDVLLEGISEPLTPFQVEAFEAVSLQFLRKHLPITINSTMTSIIAVDHFQVEHQALLMVDPKNPAALIKVPASSIHRFLYEETPVLSIRCQVDGKQVVLASNGTDGRNNFVASLARFLISNYPSYLSTLSADPTLHVLWNQLDSSGDPSSTDNNNNNIDGLGSSPSSNNNSNRSKDWSLLGAALGLSIVAVAAAFLVRRIRRHREQRSQQQRNLTGIPSRQSSDGGATMAMIGRHQTTAEDPSCTPPPILPENNIDVISEESESGWNSGSCSTDDDDNCNATGGAAGSFPVETLPEPSENCHEPFSEEDCQEISPSLVPVADDLSSTTDEEDPTWDLKFITMVPI